MIDGARTTGSILSLTLASMLGVSCGDGESCPTTAPPPFEDCLAGSEEPGCELPVTIGEGPLETTTPFFDCSGWDGDWVSPVCSARAVVGSGTNPVLFRPRDFHAGHYFVLAMDPDSDGARFCTEYQTDVYASGCPVGGEDWKCAVEGTVTIEQDPPGGFEPRMELRATFADGGMVHAVW